VKIATWNVNGIRARQGQVQELIEKEQPDVLCLQEIKASLDQLPVWLCDIEGYWCYWHGGKGYSGVALHVRRETFPDRPDFQHPEFDYEHRIVMARLPAATVASVYVPNGGKDFPAKMQFLEALVALAAQYERAGQPLVICGDLNIARTDMDVHPKERKPNIIGQRPDERALFEQLLSHGLVDVHRTLDPGNADLFTWWAPWRNLRQRNIGWRLDYVLASR
jgi:exodeoxyribonuclease-3